MSNVFGVQIFQASCHINRHGDQLSVLFEAHGLSSLANQERLEVPLRAVLQHHADGRTLCAHTKQREHVRVLEGSACVLCSEYEWCVYECISV